MDMSSNEEFKTQKEQMEKMIRDNVKEITLKKYFICNLKLTSRDLFDFYRQLLIQKNNEQIISYRKIPLTYTIVSRTTGVEYNFLVHGKINEFEKEENIFNSNCNYIIEKYLIDNKIITNFINRLPEKNYKQTFEYDNRDKSIKIY